MKKNLDLGRAWRDEDYYLSLTEEERASLGAHPAGAITDPVLKSITGGCGGGCGQPTISDVTCNTTGMCTVCPPEDCY